VNRIVLKHEGLVRRIAYKMHSRVSTFIELDDLLQSGLEGLVDAAQKYSAVEGASFESYASIRIKGSILDLIRRYGNLNRSTVQAKQMIDGKRAELTAEYGRNPTDEEIATSLRLSMGTVPACPSSPVTVTMKPRCPCAPTTAPTGMPASSSTGPCSIWVSK